jgi:hypothetical protein
VMRGIRRSPSEAHAITRLARYDHSVRKTFAHIRKFSGKLRQLVCKCAIKKGAQRRPFLLLVGRIGKSAFRELERLAGLGTAVLLALNRTRVTGKEAALFEDIAQIRLEIGQSLRDAMTNGARLA